jgi:hypothetical protein
LPSHDPGRASGILVNHVDHWIYLATVKRGSMNKIKDIRRRARNFQQRTKKSSVTTKVIPDRRKKLIQRAERQDDKY